MENNGMHCGDFGCYAGLDLSRRSRVELAADHVARSLFLPLEEETIGCKVPLAKLVWIVFLSDEK